MALSKNVRFDYFKVYATRYNKEKEVVEEIPCDLSDLFRQLQGIQVTERVYWMGDDQARLQNLECINDKWNLHFVRIRKSDFPIITKDDGTYSYFEDFEDDEGLGEEISALYDPSNYIIMMRRNRFSLSPTAVSNYFTSVINEPGFNVIFRPLIHPRAVELLRKDHLIRSAEISISDIKNARTTTKKSLGQILDKADDIKESVNIRFKISIEPKGSKKSSRIPIYEEIEEMVNDPNVQKLEVRRKADENSSVEPVDLIQHRLVDYYQFKESDFDTQARNILHETVISRMHTLYRKRVEEINYTYV